MKRTLIYLTLALSPVVQSLAQVSFGHATLFNDGWQFNLGQTVDPASPTPDIRWRDIMLPHDWSVEHWPAPTHASCQGYLPGGMGSYQKEFDVTDTTRRHYIYFEGVYNRSEVYLNGHLLGKRPNGYASFLYDMTPYLNYGQNRLVVTVDHSRQADSRWYTGSGIYRDVYMVTSGPVHFAQWGTAYEATSLTSARAIIRVSASVQNHDAKAESLRLRTTLTDADGLTVAVGTQNLTARQGVTATSLNLTVRKPRRWSLATPYLYTLRTELLDRKGRVVDTNTCSVGLRTLTFDANRGFALNGEWMKVKGVCLHHDAGVLGAAVPQDVWERRLRNLKSIGVNAIRMSHNPQQPYLYDLCDRLGLLVMDEASDEWEFPKRKWLEGWNVGEPGYEGTFDFFEEWIERDVADMVRRDRNHPSVFMWSIGNEVDYPNDPYSHPILDGAKINQPMFGGYKPEAPKAERIGKIARRLATVVRGIDTSRPTTGALAGVVMSNETEYPEAVDVVGYNYTENRYDQDHKAYPQRIIYGSENGSGIDAWRAVTDRDFIFGQFIWTGTDYLGESGRWPSRGLGTGMLDFASWTKPRGQMRASLWLDTPFTYCGTYRKGPWLSPDAPDVWNYTEGDTIRVVAYTNAPMARLLLDGKVIGELRAKDAKAGMAWWDVPYTHGVLRAEGCTESGVVLSCYEVPATGRPYALRASADKLTLSGREVSHITVEVVDEQGRRVRLADNDIRVHLQGDAARVLGVESGAGDDMSHPRAMHRRAHAGRVLTYVQSAGRPGKVRVRFSSPLLQGCEVELAVK